MYTLATENLKPVLPKYVALQSKATGKYLRYISEKKEGDQNYYFQFSEDNVTSFYTKFEVHMSNRSENDGLVHLRSVHCNKYLAVVNDSNTMLAAANKEEDEPSTDYSATLFRPCYLEPDSSSLSNKSQSPVTAEAANSAVTGDHATPVTTEVTAEASVVTDDHVNITTPGEVQIRLMHAKLGRYVCLSNDDDKCAYAYSATLNEKSYDVFNVIDYRSLVILPRYVVFKGDNELYMKASSIDRLNYLQFAASEMGASDVGDQIFTATNGRIGLWNNYWRRYWVNTGSWIRAEASHFSTNTSLFLPIQIGDSAIALRSMSNNSFCKRFSADGKSNALAANASNIETFAQLEVEEHVVAREIYDVTYRLQEARIYDVIPVIFVEKVAANHSSNAKEMTVDLTYEEGRYKSWSNSFSLSFGLRSKVRAGVPLIASGKVEMSAEIANEWAWGESETTAVTVTSSYTLVIEPKKKVTLRLNATKGYCDVPFSYTQRDTLYNGEVVTNRRHDGIYTGANSYNTTAETTEVNA